MKLKNRSFQYGKVALAVRTQNISCSLCSNWPPFARTHARSRTRHCRTARSVMFWSKQRRWDAVSSGRRRESCYGRRVAGARPAPHSPQDLGQGYRAATAKVRWNLVYCKTTSVTSSVSWSIVSEEVSCYGKNRRQKVLSEQDVTVISAINFYTRLNEHQFGSSK